MFWAWFGPMSLLSDKPIGVVVTKSWIATYPDPISIKAGDPVRLSGRKDIWDGHVWLWAIAPSNKEGWIPDTLLDGTIARYDYSAQELTCNIGEKLIVLKQTHGWSWCKATSGELGWVPDKVLKNSAPP